MSQHQLYLHYDVKNDRIIKLDDDRSTEIPFIVVIALDEQKSRLVHSGALDITNFVVNKYADPIYLLDKSQFPEGVSYFLTFDIETRNVLSVSTSEPNANFLIEQKQSMMNIDPLIAFSILSGETSLSNWEISSKSGSDINVSLKRFKSTGTLFRNRIDFDSFAEIDISTNKLEIDNSALPKICEIDFNFTDNSVCFKCEDLDDGYFANFFIAITKKNDPSYLIKTIDLSSKKQITFVFDTLPLHELSFFTSRFHLSNSIVNVNCQYTGNVIITVKPCSIKITNDISFSNVFPSASILLKNKYDDSIIYRNVVLTDNNPVIIKCDSTFDVNNIDFDSLKISKHFISILRQI